MRPVPILLAAVLASGCLRAEPFTQVPFEITGYHAFLDVELEGEILSFAFDTAADGVALSRDAMDRLGLEPTGTGTSYGANGSLNVSLVQDVDIRLGDLELSGVTAVVAPLTHLEERVGRPIDGIIGRDVLDGRVVLLDHDRNVLELHPRQSFPFDGWGEPCAVNPRGSIEAEGEVRLLDGEVVSGTFFIDSGAGAHLTFNSDFVHKHDLAGRVGDTYPRTGRGFTGRTTEDRVGRVASLSFCGYDFPAAETELPAVLSSASAGSLARSGMAGLIGNPILSRMNLVFDLERDRIYLRPTDRWDDPIRLDASGLVLMRRSSGATVVEDIIPGSAAVDGGIEAGDELLTIDGTPSASLELAELRDRLKEVDREFELRMSRQGQKRVVVIRTRSLLAEL